MGSNYLYIFLVFYLFRLISLVLLFWGFIYETDDLHMQIFSCHFLKIGCNESSFSKRIEYQCNLPYYLRTWHGK